MGTWLACWYSGLRAEAGQSFPGMAECHLWNQAGEKKKFVYWSACPLTNSLWVLHRRTLCVYVYIYVCVHELIENNPHAQPRLPNFNVDINPNPQIFVRFPKKQECNDTISLLYLSIHVFQKKSFVKWAILCSSSTNPSLCQTETSFTRLRGLFRSIVWRIWLVEFTSGAV